VWLNAYGYVRAAGKRQEKIWNTVVFFVLGDDRLAKNVTRRWWGCVTKAVIALKKHGIAEALDQILMT